MLWIKQIKNYILIGLVFWIILTINILRFSCLDLTESRLILKLPQAMIFNFSVSRY